MSNKERKGHNDSQVLEQFPDLNISELINLSAVELADKYPEIFKHFGVISFAYDQEFYPLKVSQSAAGYFIGTWNDEGPQRESEHYYETKEMAEQALKIGDWSQWFPWYVK